MRAGFTGVAGGMREQGRQSGYLSNQMRALSTTFRYAIAGTTIYGLVSALRSYAEFEAKLGEISAIATLPGDVQLAGNALDDLGKKLIDISNETAVPISELQQGVIALYSTIGDTPTDDAVRMMDIIARVSIATQSTIEDTTNALLGQMNAFHANTDAIGKYGDEFYKVIQESAGMMGKQYSEKLGTIASSAALGGFTAEQMGGLAIAATRYGGSAATNMQGLGQLMLYLMHPRGGNAGQAEKALRKIGLGEDVRARIGGYATLKRFLAAANAGGVATNPSLLGANEETLNQMQELSDQGGFSALTGKGGKLLSTVLGRIQSQRIAAILASMLYPTQVAGTKNKTLDQYIQDVSKSAGEVNSKIGEALDRRRIQEAGQAFHNLGIEMMDSVGWLLNPAAGGLKTGVSAMQNHAGIADAGLFAGLIGAFLLRGRMGVGGIGKGLLGAQAVTSAAGGAIQLGATPVNPLYVVVVGQLLGGVNAGTILGGGGVGTGGAGGTARGGRLGRITPFIGPLTALAAGGFAAWQANTAANRSTNEIAKLFGVAGVNGGLGGAFGFGRSGYSVLRDAASKDPLLMEFLAGKNPAFHGRAVSVDQEKILASFLGGSLSADKAQAMLLNILKPFQISYYGRKAVQELVGKAKIDVNISKEMPDGSTKRIKKGVSVDLVPLFKAPQMRGQAGKQPKGGQ